MRANQTLKRQRREKRTGREREREIKKDRREMCKNKEREPDE